MLTESDRDWIKANRSELTEGRTVTVTLIPKDERERDPFTGELNGDPPVPIEATCIWREIQSVSRTQLNTVEGVEVREGDVEAKFSDDIDVNIVDKITRDTIEYKIVSVNRAGFGEEYKYMTLLRRVT